MHNWTQSHPARPQGGREGGLSWGRLPGGVTEAVSPGDSRQASPTARHRLSWPLWGPLGRGAALTVGREPTATGAGRSDAAPRADPADNSVRGSTDPEAEATSRQGPCATNATAKGEEGSLRPPSLAGLSRGDVPSVTFPQLRHLDTF